MLSNKATDCFISFMQNNLLIVMSNRILSDFNTKDDFSSAEYWVIMYSHRERRAGRIKARTVL